MFKQVIELTKNMHNLLGQRIENWSETVGVENDVRKLSSGIFLDAFKQVAKEISEITGVPYLTYLNKAKEMLLRGSSAQDTMHYFDNLWCDLKFGKLQEGR